jgi:hypothetical protein
MILILKDEKARIKLTLRDAEIVRTYRNNCLGFWCVYRTATSTNDGQFFVSEDDTLSIYQGDK